MTDTTVQVQRAWSYEEIERTLEQVAAERPDYVYEQVNGLCVYYVYDPAIADEANDPHAVDTSSPSCAVGHALHRLGVPPDLVAASNDQGIDQVYDDLADLGYALDGYEARGLLVRMQNNQDAKVPWGRAFAEAKAGRVFHALGSTPGLVPFLPETDVPENWHEQP